MEFQDLEMETLTPVATELQEKQIAHLTETLRFSPQSESLHFQLGQLYFETQNPGQAEYHFRRSLLASGNYPAAHSGLAALYKQVGNHQLATYHYRKACELEPGLRSEILNRFFDSQSR